MKKSFFVFIFIFVLFSGICFAEDAQYIEYQTSENTDDGAIYLNSYEDYENIVNNSVDEQEVYKKEYINNLTSQIMSYNESKRNKVSTAKVLKAGSVQEYYSYDNYGLYKIRYQEISVEVIKGEHIGETFDVSYVLTADSYNNIKLKEVRKGQKVNIVFDESDEGVFAYITVADSITYKVNAIIILAIITLVVALMYLKKDVLKFVPQMLLLLNVIALIFVPNIYEGASIFFLSLIAIILYIVVDSAIRVGVNHKMVATIFTTLVIDIFMVCMLVLFNNYAGISGIDYGYMTIIETLPTGNVDFYSLYISMFVLITTVLVSGVSGNIINSLCDKENDSLINKYIVDKLPFVFGILVIKAVPKLLYVLVAKYEITEILNSEMLTNDLILSMFLILAIVLSKPISNYSKKWFVD